MTDMFHYQDVFTNINIPKSGIDLTLQAKDLLDGAHNINWTPDVQTHLSKIVDTSEVSQAFWNFENDAEFTYDRFVITAMSRGLTLAAEHRSFNNATQSFRSSLRIENGGVAMHFIDLSKRGLVGERSTQSELVDKFNDHFVQVTANLGLQRHIQSLHQNESNSATFASAA